MVKVSKLVELLSDTLRDHGGAIAKKDFVQQKAIINKHLVKYYR